MKWAEKSPAIGMPVMRHWEWVRELQTVEGIMSGGERDDEADAVSEVTDEGMKQ